MSQMPGSPNEKSLRWMVISLFLLVAGVGWGFLAGSYADAHAVVADDSEAAQIEVIHLRRGTGALAAVVMLFASVIVFVVNAVTQLPNLPWVIGWHFTNRIWLPILILLLEAAVIAGGLGLQRLEANLALPPGQAQKKRRRKKKRKSQGGARASRNRQPPRQKTLGDGYGDFDMPE